MDLSPQLRPTGLKSGTVDGRGAKMSWETEAPKKNVIDAQNPSPILLVQGPPFKCLQ